MGQAQRRQIASVEQVCFTISTSKAGAAQAQTGAEEAQSRRGASTGQAQSKCSGRTEQAQSRRAVAGQVRSRRTAATEHREQVWCGRGALAVWVFSRRGACTEQVQSMSKVGMEFAF